MRPSRPLFPPLEEIRVSAERSWPELGIPSTRAAILARVRRHLGDSARLTDLQLAWLLVSRGSP